MIKGKAINVPFKNYDSGGTNRSIPIADFPEALTLKEGDYLLLFGEMPVGPINTGVTVFECNKEGNFYKFSGSEFQIESFFSMQPMDPVKGYKVLKLVPKKNILPGFYFVHKYVGINGYALLPFIIGANPSFAKSLGMKFVRIPAGTFMMGSPSNESGRYSNETQHRVTLTKPYYMQTTEVTQGQWRAVMGSNPSHFSSCGDSCPVEKVSWDDCREFIRKLNQKEGTDKYRLPTEAEWEYACRAGTDTALYSGPIRIFGERNAPALDPIAWYGGNSCVDYSGGYDCSGWSEKQKSCSRCGTHPVALKTPNSWGLYDMIGNVWEWCSDWYGDYPSNAVTDPDGPSSGKFRVLRGGSWGDDARGCRSAIRNGYSPDGLRFSFYGFRLVRDF